MTPRCPAYESGRLSLFVGQWRHLQSFGQVLKAVRVEFIDEMIEQPNRSKVLRLGARDARIHKRAGFAIRSPDNTNYPRTGMR